MWLKFGFVLFCIGSALSPAFSEEKQVVWEEEVQGIDEHIQSLKDSQEKLRSSAQRNANNAMRWQFQKENYSDARKAWAQAALEKQKVQEIEDQIRDLETRKEKILQEHGQQKSS